MNIEEDLSDPVNNNELQRLKGDTTSEKVNHMEPTFNPNGLPPLAQDSERHRLQNHISERLTL